MSQERLPKYQVDQARTLPKITKAESGFVPGQLGVFTDAPVKAGNVILSIRGPVKTGNEARTRFTLQVGPNEHLDPSREDDQHETGMYINHSCEPNAAVIIALDDPEDPRLDVVAIEDLSPGTEITMHYGLFEAEMTIEGVPCLCGSKRCLGVVSGYKNLPPERRAYFTDRGLVPQHLLDVI